MSTKPPDASEPRSRRREPTPEPAPASASNVFVPSSEAIERRSYLRWYLALSVLGLVAVGAVGVLVAWPLLHPRKLDPVERVAQSFLDALVNDDAAALKRVSVVADPPAIRSAKGLTRDRKATRTIRGSFAPLAAFHARIDAEYELDPGSGRYTPKNALGAAAETLDALHSAKDDAEKSGLYKKMQSGDPNELFDAAEEFGKVFTKLAETTLAPQKIVPTYKMLVEQSKPPLSPEAKALALDFAESSATWDALLKRPYAKLKADGPFVFDKAEVTALVSDKLASMGDPPSRLRLSLVRFRLEGIDTGWKVVSARRDLPPAPAKPAPPAPESESLHPR